ncbi:MAG: AraC family transcriptional regulator [Pseudomonadota bacterium]
MSFFHEKTETGTTRREPPRGYVTLIMCFADPIAISPLDATAQSVAAFATGAASGALLAICGANNTGIEIHLCPWFAARLLGVDPLEAMSGVVDVTHLLPTGLGQRPKRPTVSVNEHIDQMIDWLPCRAATMSKNPRPEIVHAWSLLEASAGTMHLADLAGRVGYSHRHFKHMFEAKTGLKPKQAARLIRFGRVLELIESSATPSLSEIAYGCGYSDQSHLTREFDRFAAMTPAAFSALRMNELQGFAEPAAR